MLLIEYSKQIHPPYSKQSSYSNKHFYQLSNLFITFQNLSDQFQFYFNNPLQQFYYIDICQKIFISSLQCSFNIIFFYSKYIKTYNHIQKNTLIRYFLKINKNQHTLTFKINPKNGYFALFFTNHIKQNIDDLNIFQFLHNLYKNQMKFVQNQILQIFKFLKFQIPFEQTERIQLQQLKLFSKISYGYAWKMLKFATQSKKQNQHISYQQKRKQFYKKIREQTIDHQTNKINLIYSQINSFDNFHNNFPNKQRFLYQKYLSRTGINYKGKLINKLRLSQVNYNLLIKNKRCTVQNNSQGKIHLSLRKKKQVMAVKYEKQILKKFQNFQYMGFPKYYIIQNYQKQTQSFMITNLTFSAEYKTYLQKNYQCISIITKLHLMHQIALALKYIRDNNIVYHKLIPQNLFIKKGLFIKIIDFSNAMSNQICIQDFKTDKYSPLTNYLPYVSTYQFTQNKSAGDQKSDVFSLGNILYELLYGKTPFLIKNGFHSSKITQYLKILLFPLKIVVQKQNIWGNQFYKILTYLALECVHHQSLKQIHVLEDFSNIERRRRINIKDRPYLDWIIVIIRSILQIQKEKIV